MSLIVVVDVPFGFDEISKGVENGGITRAGTVFGLVVVGV